MSGGSARGRPQNIFPAVFLRRPIPIPRMKGKSDFYVLLEATGSFRSHDLVQHGLCDKKLGAIN